jgi:hypothetical protein
MTHAAVLNARTQVLAGCLLLLGGAPSGASGVLYPASFDAAQTAPLVTVDPRYVLPKVSTLGVGIEYRYRHAAGFDVRAEWFEYDEVRPSSRDALQVRADLRLRAQSVLVDWFPFDGRFRTTAGIYLLSSDISAVADYHVQLGTGTTVTASDANHLALQAAQDLRHAGYGVLAARLEEFAATNSQPVRVPGGNYSTGSLIELRARLYSRPYAPYLGVGWASANAGRHGWFYSIDAGMMYLGRMHAGYAVVGPIADALRGPELDALIRQEERAADDRLAKYRYCPILSLGLWYSF